MNKMKMYSNWPAAFRRFIETILCMVIAHYIHVHFDTSIDIGEPSFMYASIWKKWTALIIKGTAKIFKAFAKFSSQEVVMIASG